MKYRGRRESDNVEDISTDGGSGEFYAGGSQSGEVKKKGKSNPILGCLIVLILGGGGFIGILAGAGGASKKNTATTTTTTVSTTNTTSRYTNTYANDASGADFDAKKFVRVVLADNEDVWHQIFEQNGMDYIEPKLVLYTNAIKTACGDETSVTGPFYCPGDQKIYIDLQACDELKSTYHAGGDFAMAYTVAHEVAHHVQQLMGTMDEVYAKQEKVGKKQANRLSVALELQADFYAGVWAHHTQNINGSLEDGDIEEAIRNADAVGDDRLGYSPDEYDHGSAAQRVYWFKKGYETGDIGKGTTFDDLEVE